MKRHRRQGIQVVDAQGNTLFATVTAEYPMSVKTRAALEEIVLAAGEYLRKKVTASRLTPIASPERSET